jgi:choline kinase
VPKLADQRYWDAFDATAAKLGDKANVENVLDGLAAEGGEISVCDISGSWWTEIDTPEDLGKARQIILSRLS